LTDCIAAWDGNFSIHDRKTLQRVLKKAKYNTGTVL
jgi:hypothetical protein